MLISNTLVTDKVSVVTYLCVYVIARGHDKLYAREIVVLPLAKRFNIIRGPVDAVEASVWIVLYLTDKLFIFWVWSAELCVVILCALVKRYMPLKVFAGLLAIHSSIPLDIARVVFRLTFIDSFDGNGHTEVDWIKLQLI